ncbi:PD-(D/E)XK nuclease family protein [Bacillus taeanensis]|nr:PD-(D/E)XK nuclease family protein [Bacillus taeanensis]
MAIGPYPSFSWSYSRNSSFNGCLREYYYNYYGYHFGWSKNADPEIQRIYRLKKLNSLYMVFGNAVQELTFHAFNYWSREGRLPTIDQLESFLRKELNKAVADSRNKAAFIRTPKKVLMLHESYYNEELPIDTIKTRINCCTLNFLRSKSVQEIINNTEKIELVEVDNPKEFSEPITFKGEQLFAIPDLLYKKGDKWIVVDWKTGKEDDDHVQQIYLYVLYVHYRYGIDVENIEARIEYLLYGTNKDVDVYEEEVEWMEKKMSESINSMKNYLEDPVDNKPKHMESFQASPSSFKCKTCNFREVCVESIV